MTPRPAPRAAPDPGARPPLPAHGPLVVLCGPMGSGKTTVGRALARRWAVGLRDTDADVEERVGADVAEIFRTRGEEAFRALEHEAVAAALAEHRGVLALGGGAVLREDTRRDLAAYAADGGVVVFLDVSLEHAAPRVGLDASRPLLQGDPRRRWADLMAQRRATYEAVATLRVPTDGRTAGEVAGEIERRLLDAAGRVALPGGPPRR